MAQTINRLTARKVETVKTPGYLKDGGGLFLQVGETGSKSWIFEFRFAGRRREMGLGSLERVSLAAARAARDECNQLLRSHTDPIERRKQERAAAILTAHGTITFADAIDKYLTAHAAEWSPKHAQAWRQTLTQYAVPELGRLLVSDITTAHIVRVLEPTWPTPMATMLRGRLEKVLDWCKVRAYRAGENPAAWKGNLDHLLANPTRSRKVEHHRALPIDEVPKFMAKLRAQEGATARCLEFLILSAARADEARRATSAEIDYANKVWTVPAGRMKARKEHRVPLSARAMALAGQGGADYLYPGTRAKTVDAMSMRRLLERMGYGERASVHGMRSCFRDWAAERTNYPNHVVEMALAHTIGDKVEASYRRGDLFNKRAQLMDAWAEYCSQPPAKSAGKVLPLRKAK
jgi:integrase